MKADIALLGLGVMGQSLARNLASRDLRVLTYNRTTEKGEKFINQYGNEYLELRTDLKQLVSELETPRKLILMVPAGEAVDGMIEALAPLLDTGDILIDGGNSHFPDTIRRNETLKAKGIHYVGMGVSGGEEGALRGPSIMPGCEKEVWEQISPILKKIAAKDFDGEPCVTHVGTDGAGHYVKMVHNGIEYGVMQLMAESYQLLKEAYGLSADEIGGIFEKYNEGKLKSFLFEISVPVLRRKDDLGDGNLIDQILDKAGQKGTGRWTSVDALQRGAVIPSLTEAVFARGLSSFKEERKELAQLYSKDKAQPTMPKEDLLPKLEDALYAGMISCYAQGFELIRLAAEEQGWEIDFAEVSRIWEGGCIIRADLLNFLHKAFESTNGKAVHLFTIDKIREALMKDAPALREIVGLGFDIGIPMQSMGTALSYFESMTSETVSANFIQGLRDFFGAHTYERTDREGTFHTPWSNLNL